jgi:hypothetical protein
MPKPKDVTIDMALCVLDAGHGTGGIRRGPRISNAFLCRAMNFRRGDSCKVVGKLKMGGI